MRRDDPEQLLCNVRREFGEHGGVVPSISRSTTFTVMEPETMPLIFEGERGPDNGGCYLYSRHYNPTVSVLGRQLAGLEGMEAGLCTASGMAAITCTLLQLCQSGDHIVSSNTVYGGTHALLSEVFPQMGISTSFVHHADAAGFLEQITPRTKLIFAETMGNPTLSLVDIQQLAAVAHDHHLPLVIDNTFAPTLVTPAHHGADIVIHSLTKHINGACDILGGVICGPQSFIDELMDLHHGRVMLFGPTMDPRVAYDIIQRLPHLPVRMREHGRRAMAVARRLEEMGIRVAYPGLPSHPQHALVKRMFNHGYGFGGVVAIDCKTNEKAQQLIAALQNDEQFGLMAVSLGYYDTLMSCSGSTTSSEIPAAAQEEMGLSSGLIRMSVGITGSLTDRLHQLERAVYKTGLITSMDTAVWQQDYLDGFQ